MNHIKTLIKADLIRYVGYDNLNYKSFFKAYFKNPGFRFLFWFRLCSSKNKFVFYVSRYYHRKYSIKYSLSIPYDTKIGGGLHLGHGHSIVINSNAKIGKNVNIAHFTSIGSNYSKAAIIGDNVYIGPNVNIVEDVVIGNGVIIGAGSVVCHSILDGNTVAGVPAKVIGLSNKHNFINNIAN